MPSLFFVAFLAIASLQGTFGAPCAQGLSSCVSKCKAKTGWPSHPMGNNTWGTPSSVVPSSSPAANPDYGKPAPTSASTPKPSSTPAAASSSNIQTSTPASNSSGSVSSSDIDAYLSAHNAARAAHGAAALTWSNSLSAVAQAWADGCKFQHSGGQFGENLAAGTGDAYGIAQAIKSWTDESSQYDPNNPVPSHFTQVVWKSTTQVGCAHQDCSGIFDASFGPAHYHVCEYSPAGNVIGEFPQNVQA